MNWRRHNQYASRTVPRAFDVIGKASTTAAVTANGSSTSRLDEFFYKELSTGSGAVHIPYTIQATDGTGTTTRSGGKFLPATPETFTYDSDGNLTSDGRFTYTWDAENRLIAMETATTVPLPARRKLAFSYDAMGRRISKTVWHGTSSGGWQLHHKFDFIHELNGWNILAERSGGSKDSFLRTYTWGTDLSGSLNGAGGVGGLVFTKLHTSGKTFANGMDLNGNVTLLVNMASGQLAATYDYGPFGEPLRQSGEYATLNPLRFSTKYTDDETGLVAYEMRYYNPSTGTWPSRDPIEEKGGVNLYGFIQNNGICQIDVFGTYIFSNESDEFREKLKLALQKIAGGELYWCTLKDAGIQMPQIKDYDGKDAYVLLIKVAGNNSFWNDIATGFDKYAHNNYVIINRAGADNGGGANKGNPRRVVIPLNPQIQIPVDGGKREIDGKTPIYDLEPQSFESLVWHELVGHSIKGLSHPEKNWNTYEFKNEKRNPQQQALWDKGDPTVTYENTVRAELKEKPRRLHYWDLKAHWPSQKTKQN